MGYVLVVDDQIGDIMWLLDLLESMGHEYVVAPHEEKARELLQEVKQGKVRYDLAIFDVMVSIKDMREIIKIKPELLADSSDAGVRLCEHVRNELDISAKVLPIVCLTARPDHESFLPRLKKLKIQLFSRIPEGKERSIRDYITENLPEVPCDQNSGDEQ